MNYQDEDGCPTEEVLEKIKQWDLIEGGEGSTFEECREHLQYLIDIGTSPYPQRYRPLDSLNTSYDPPGWEKGQLELLFQYYGVPPVWRTCEFEQFSMDKKKLEEKKRNGSEQGNLI